MRLIVIIIFLEIYPLKGGINKMGKNNLLNFQLTIIFVILIIAALGAFVFYQTMNGSPKQTVEVNGQAEVNAIPDVVSIYLKVDSNASNAKDAKDDNARIVENVLSSLRNLGFGNDEVSTQSFNVYEDYEWTSNGRKLLGFKASHILRVELSSSNLDSIGDVVDSGIDNGALLQYINFEISSDKQNEYKASATLLATQNAKMQAEAMAKGLGMNLGKVISVSDANFGGYHPYRAFDSEVLEKNDMVGSEVAQVVTNIQPGEQKIYANVNVLYELK
jgi:uncharacterized protein